MKLYSLITGPDDDTFCHRVTERLNRGWAAHGVPTLTYDPERKRIICGQAVIKVIKDKEYSPDIDLASQ
jgi:hypothetical protein